MHQTVDLLPRSVFSCSAATRTGAAAAGAIRDGRHGHRVLGPTAAGPPGAANELLLQLGRGCSRKGSRIPPSPDSVTGTYFRLHFQPIHRLLSCPVRCHVLQEAHAALSHCILPALTAERQGIGGVTASDFTLGFSTNGKQAALVSERVFAHPCAPRHWAACSGTHAFSQWLSRG